VKIADVRSSFSVYVIISDVKAAHEVSSVLETSGYMVAQFNQLSAAMSEIPSNPPHMVLFAANEATFDVKRAVSQMLTQLPESHVFMVVPASERQAHTNWRDLGVFDLISLPLATPSDLLHSLDHAAERDYYMYINEQLMEKVNAAATPSATIAATTPTTPTAAVNTDCDFAPALALLRQESPTACMEQFFRALNNKVKSDGLIHFKYLPNRRVLMAAQSEGVENVDLGSLGLDFNEAAPSFKSSQLREPMKLLELRNFIQEIFNCENFLAYPVVIQNEVEGIIVILSRPQDEATQRWIQDGLELLGRALARLEIERRLHVSSIYDFGTDVLNKNVFETRLQQEISRARRTNLPVALLSVAFDQYNQIATQVGPEEAETMLRMAARIIQKHSRVNDLIGRTGADELGILLPHTSRKGALVKAERLRQLLQGADFSRVLKAFPRVSLSIGISEYPSLVRDAVELQQSADEALHGARRVGNKTGVAQPPANFTPDFDVHGGGAP